MFFEDMLLIIILLCSCTWVSVNIPQPWGFFLCILIGFSIGLWHRKLEDERKKK